MDKSLFKKIKKETLTDAEKASGLLALREFMQAHPVKIPTEKEYMPILSFLDVNFLRQKMVLVAGIFGLLIFVTTGTAFAAQRSLPGDILYPIKIHVNEKIESLATLSKKASAQVEIKHTLTRLDEAESLLNQNKLTDKNKDEIKKNFSANLEETSKNINNLQNTNDTSDKDEFVKINDGFKKSLEKHHEIILKITEKETKKDKDIVAPVKKLPRDSTEKQSRENLRALNNEETHKKDDTRDLNTILMATSTNNLQIQQGTSTTTSSQEHETQEVKTQTKSEIKPSLPQKIEIPHI